MIDHLGIFVSDTARSFPFYEKALAPLGILVRERNPNWGSIIMTGERRRPFLFIGPAGGDYHGTEVKIAERRPVHLAFRAASKEAVEEFYRIGLEYGGRDNGPPGDCGRGAYGAFLLDPDGNNIEAVYRESREAKKLPGA
jgi:catechol 2,3-dioxygenase-like lactoylglutathione lyase family enzyme